MSIEQDVPVGDPPLPLGLLTSGLMIGGPAGPFDDEWFDDEWFDDGPSGGPEPRDLGDALGLVGQLMVCARSRSQDLARELSLVHAVSEEYRRRGSEFAADEIGSALGWSRSMAAAWLELARDVVVRLPALHMVLRTGALDEVKVRAIAEHTRAMPDDLAREVTARVLPQASDLCVSTLIELIGSVADALDADWAARRERTARQRVRVVGTMNPTGTTDVSIRDLHPQHGVAVMARVEALAAPIRRTAIARGLRAPIHAVRALVSVRLQDGSCVGLDDDALVAALVEQLPDWLHEHGLDDPPDAPGPGSAGPDDVGPGPTDPGPTDPGPTDPGPTDPGPTDPGPTDPGPTDPGPTDPEPDSPAAESEPTDPEPDSPATDPGPTDPEPDSPAARSGGDAVAPGTGGDTMAEDVAGAATTVRPHGRLRTGTTELRLRLSTALGIDELPGSLPSWGRITAPAARDMLARARSGDSPTEWRLVLTDDHGHLDHVLLVHPGSPHRPPGRPPGPRRSRTRRGRTRGRMIVELAAPTTMLAALDLDDHPAWASWIRRARTRLTDLTDLTGITGPADEPATETGPARRAPHHPATSAADAHRRRPGRELDRWVRSRDRHCIGPMCTRAVHSVDIDHTRDWVDHGRTVAANLGGPCRHCHRLKHEGGWRLDQPTPGRFRWHTLLGAVRSVEPRPVLTDLPAPAPRPDRRPRPVTDVGPPCDDREPPWVDRSTPRPFAPAEVPSRPPPPRDVDHPDDPPF